MRLAQALRNDIRYQIRYGFYFLYVFITLLYAAIIVLVPEEYKSLTAAVIIMSDPAMLGFFFIGGIWLLESGEGVHKFYAVSPLTPIEYIMSKTISLSLISTLSALGIMIVGVREVSSYPFLLAGVFIGSMIFTILGMLAGTFSRTVNHYLLISVPAEIFIVVPPILAVFKVQFPVLEVFPGTLLWRLISEAMGPMNPLTCILLLLSLLTWLGFAILVSYKRISTALLEEGGPLQ